MAGEYRNADIVYSVHLAIQVIVHHIFDAK